MAIAPSESKTTARRPQFGIGTLLIAVCVFGSAGGLLAKWLFSLTARDFEVALSSMFYVSGFVFYVSIFVTPVLMLSIVVQVARTRGRPVFAVAYLGAVAIIVIAPLGQPLSDAISVVNGLLVGLGILTLGCWIEIWNSDQWAEHWPTALAMTMATGSYAAFLLGLLGLALASV